MFYNKHLNFEHLVYMPRTIIIYIKHDSVDYRMYTTSYCF
jgi:hypothetical protein